MVKLRLLKRTRRELLSQFRGINRLNHPEADTIAQKIMCMVAEIDRDLFWLGLD